MLDKNFKNNWFILYISHLTILLLSRELNPKNLMNKIALFTLLLMGPILMSSCGSKDDECTKTLEITHYGIENNKFKRYFVMEEVSCDFVA